MDDTSRQERNNIIECLKEISETFYTLSQQFEELAYCIEMDEDMNLDIDKSQ